MQTKEALRSYFWKYLLCFGAVGLVLWGIFALRHRHDQPLLDPTGYRVSGSFVPNGVPATTRWLHNEDIQFSLGSQVGDDRNTGTFVSRAFAAPETLGFFVSGNPSLEGNQLYLEVVGGSEKLYLRTMSDRADEWRQHHWILPKNWRGRTVQLVADDHSTDPQGWLGITLPRGNTAADELQTSLSRAFFAVASILLAGIVFLLPGIAIAWLLDYRYKLDEIRFVCVTFLSSGAAGYFAFWIYLLNAKAGKIASKGLVFASLVIVVYAVLARRANLKLFREIAACALLMVTLTTFYTAVGFLYEYSEDPVEQAQERFIDPLPVDNGIPYLFADKLYSSQPIRPFLMGDWKSSDRPPLQTGLALLQFPLWQTENREFNYQILGTLLQSMWLVAIWILLRQLSVDRRVVVIVCAFCIFSRFFLMHSFYVWPKLLSASFFIFALAALRFAEGKVDRCAPFDAGVAGAAIALALLSHGGVAFSAIALAIVLLVGRKLPPVRSLVAGAAMLLLFLLPWMLYQKLYDPPGNRLLKWHLAGAMSLDSRTFSQTFIDAYSQPKPSQIVENKIENVKALFGPWDIRAQGKGLLDWYKTGTFFYLFQTFNFLNLGFFVFLAARVFSFKPGSSVTFSAVQRLFLLSFVSIAVWCLLMYIPGSTVIHQGSLADDTLLFVGLIVTLAVATPRLMYALFGLQVLVLFPLFAFTEAFVRPHSSDVVWAGAMDPGMAVLLLLGLLTLAILGWKAGFSATGQAAAAEGSEALRSP